VRGAPFWCRRADTLEAGDVIFVRLQIFCIGEATRKRCGKSELMVSEKLDAFTRADFDIRTGASNAIRENFRTAIQANQILDERAAQLALGDFAKGIRNPGNLSTKSGIVPSPRSSPGRGLSRNECMFRRCQTHHFLQLQSNSRPCSRLELNGRLWRPIPPVRKSISGDSKVRLRP
jgi:hypothetical protein